MNNNLEFLKFVSKNAEMGFTAIKDLFGAIDDREFKKIIKEQQKKYREIYDEAVDLLDKYDAEPKDLSSMEKISSYIMIKMELIKDNSINNIAEMMIKGSNMGIIDIEKKLNTYDELDKKVNHLGEKLLETEQNNIEQLKPFLKEIKKDE